MDRSNCIMFVTEFILKCTHNFNFQEEIKYGYKYAYSTYICVDVFMKRNKDNEL